MSSTAREGLGEPFDIRRLPERVLQRTWLGDNLSAQRVRDVILVETSGQSFLIACDSNAGMGEKPGDSIRVPAQLVGHNAAKVPVMEVLAAGGVPFLVISNLCCDLASTGRFIIDGIADLLADTGIRPMMTGSDETNNPTVQTGVGVTVIGTVAPGAVRIGRARDGDEVVALGIPFFDPSRIPFREKTAVSAMPKHVIAALRQEFVREALPVGSRGVAYETEQLAAAANLTVVQVSQTRIDVGVSAGPSDCFLVAAAPGHASDLETCLDLPATVVAVLAA